MNTPLIASLFAVTLIGACRGQSTEPSPAEAPAADASSPPPAKAKPMSEAEQPWLPDEARTLDPQVEQARVLVEADQAAEALVLLEARISAAPTDADAFYWRGKAHAAGDDGAAAELDYRRAVELDGGWIEARQSLADLLVATHRCDDAVPLLLLQVEAMPESGHAWANLGFCRVRGDEPLSGLADLRKGCSLGYQRACESVARAERRGAPPATP